VELYSRKGSSGIDSSSKSGYNGKRTRRRKVVRYISNNKVGEDNIRAIRRELYSLFDGIDDAIANNIAIDIDSTIYVVDAGMDDGELSFGVRKILDILDAEQRRKVKEDINEKAINNRNVSPILFGEIRHSSNNKRGGSIEGKLGKELSAYNGESADNEGGILKGNADRGVGGLNSQSKKDGAQFSLKETNDKSVVEKSHKMKIKGYLN